jgi:FtsH-binding integral membrane protein
MLTEIRSPTMGGTTMPSEPPRYSRHDPMIATLTTRPDQMPRYSHDGLDTDAYVQYAPPSQSHQARVRANVAKTYAWTAGGLGLMASTASLASQTALMAFPTATMVGGGIAGTIGLIGSSAQVPNSTMQRLSWAAGCVGMGLTLAPLSFLPAGLLVHAAIATGAMLAALSVAAYVLPPDTVGSWAGPLSAMLTGIVILGFAQMVLPARFAFAARQIDIYGGFVVFSAMLVASTQQFWRAAEAEDYSPTTQSAQLMLTILNLFVRMLEVLAESSMDERGRSRQRA